MLTDGHAENSIPPKTLFCRVGYKHAQLEGHEFPQPAPSIYQNNLQLSIKIYGKITGPRNTGHWPTYTLWDLCVILIIQSVTFIHQTVFKILSKITGPWNIGHWPTYTLWGPSLSHCSIIPSMIFIHQIVFKIQGKTTGPWCHWPTYILGGQFLCHTDPLYQVWHSATKYM